MSIRTRYFAAALALSLAAPVSAVAAPNGNMMMSGHQDAFHDRNHRPPMRAERRPPMPHGRYQWRAGSWSWRNGAWIWLPGLWIRF